MLSDQSQSKSHAMSAAILGHSNSGMGEKSLAIKINQALKAAGYQTFPVVDIIEKLGADYETFAKLNYELASSGETLLDSLSPPLAIPKSDLLLILSWNFGLAAALATGIQHTRPTALKFTAHHTNEKILPKLYDAGQLLLTESLLGNERAYRYGLDSSKVLYLPHSYPQECSHVRTSRSYVEKLAASQNKTIRPATRVIGCVGRFEYGKNCEWAVEAVRLLAEEGNDVVLVLKGNFPEHSPCLEFKPRFEQMLATYKDRPWLLWDPTPTPFPQVIEEYAAFDLLVQPSGAEGASHVVVECLGLGKPVVLLNCSTNPFLFKGLAHFVKIDPQIREAQLPFYVPEMKALCRALMQPLTPPDPKKVEDRFHEKCLIERMPLLFERDPKQLQALYKEDCKRYGL